MHFEEELKHLKIASDMLFKYEGRDWEQLFVGGAEFPSLLRLKSNKEYIREVLKTVRLTGYKEITVPINDMPDTANYFRYQRQVNPSTTQVASHNVIEKYIQKYGEDYRYEDKPHVDKLLRNRKEDNTELGRKKGL